MKLRNALCAVLAAVLLSVGVATTTHLYDAHTADRDAVTAYNDGWLDATCNSGAAWAIRAYGANCH